MLIEKINITPLVNINTQLKKKRNMNNYLYNSQSDLPFTAYRDYNISFSAQINRSPANFYEFNKNNLPAAMAEYLNADYEDRQNMPPFQMMKLVYDDLNYIKSLDFVPGVFPNEPLFSKLTDKPNIKARKGLVAEIETFKDEMNETPLFKDGSSNVGMFLLKKIYLEGKQTKEINEDFYADLSDEYKGLITCPVDYSTTRAYGIQFPKVSFWNSFVVTRDDWKYVYKPRKIYERADSPVKQSELTLGDIISGNVQPKPPKFKLNTHDINRITEAIIKSHGDKDTIVNHLRKKGVNDSEKTSFILAYSSQIMSVALEKIHASEEMRDFFENYENKTKKQQERLNAYWKSNPRMRLLQSLAISDTIKLFFEVYGADGNNPEFRELIAYADSIKPNREAELAEHNRKQAEYEELFREYEPVPEQTFKPEPLSDEEIEKQLEAEALKNGAESFIFISPAGEKCFVVCNVDEIFEQNFRNDLKLLPSGFVNRYMKFVKSSPHVSTEYKKAVALTPSVPAFVKQQLMPIENINNIALLIFDDFEKKYPLIVRACEQSVIEIINERINNILEDKNMLEFNTLSIQKLAQDPIIAADLTPSERVRMDKLYLDYSVPVCKKDDINKINQQLINYIGNANPVSKEWDDDNFEHDLFRLLTANIMLYPKLKSELSKIIRQNKFIENYGGAAKIILNPDASDDLKRRRCLLMLCDLLKNNAKELYPLLVVSPYNVQKFVHDKEMQLLFLT